MSGDFDLIDPGTALSRRALIDANVGSKREEGTSEVRKEDPEQVGPK